MLFCLITFFSGYSQFTDPPGDNGPLSQEKKTIYKNNHACWPWATSHKTKTVCCRRLKFRAHLYDNCWYNEDELPSPGWNKLGKIAYEFTTNDEDKYKMHVGWRMKNIDNQQYLRLSLYYHENYYYVSHILDDISFSPDAEIWVDMYLSDRVIGLVIGDKCIGIKGYGNPSIGGTFTKLRKTFWFGGESTAPHNMEMRYDNMHYDKPGFQEVFNSRNYMIWNLSNFTKFNDYTFTASKQIDGSGEESWVTTNDPYLNKNGCIIHNGANITFIDGERIVLHKGFKVNPGGHFIAKICPQIKILSVPEEYIYPLCYTVENATSAHLKVYYKEWTSLKWTYIGGYNGEIIGNQICFGSKATLPPSGEYKLVATFSNACMDKTTTDIYDIFKDGKLIIVDSLSKQITNNYTGKDHKYKSTEVSENELNKSTNRLILFPNPAKNSLNIKLFDETSDQINQIIIYDNFGKEVYYCDDIHVKILSINLSNYQSGLYLVKVTSDNLYYMEKFFKTN